MKLRLLILLILLSSSHAHAKLVFLCLAERAPLQLRDFDFTEREEVEVDTQFSPTGGGSLRATAAFSFKLLPTLEFHYELMENLSRGQLRYGGNMIASRRDTGAEVKRGGLEIKFRTKVANKNLNVAVACGLYNKTGVLELAPAPLGARERLRRESLNPGTTRDYSSGSDNLSMLDLHQQLLALPGPQGDLLRNHARGLAAAGLKALWYSSIFFHVDQFSSEWTRVSSAVEQIKLTMEFHGNGGIRSANYRPGETRLLITALIHRPPGSRIIQGYEILKVAIDQGGGGHGGNASSSGGRTK